MPPPPVPPHEAVVPLVEMVLPSMRGEPLSMWMPPPEHAVLPVMTLLMMVGEDLVILTPPPVVPLVPGARPFLMVKPSSRASRDSPDWIVTTDPRALPSRMVVAGPATLLIVMFLPWKLSSSG